MANRTANYTAFYVAEPFNESNLGANATPDFCYYNTLRAWKGKDSTFPFVDGLYNRQQSTPALKSKDSQTDNFVHKD